jgi:hypothetical protein
MLLFRLSPFRSGKAIFQTVLTSRHLVEKQLANRHFGRQQTRQPIDCPPNDGAFAMSIKQRVGQMSSRPIVFRRKDLSPPEHNN